MRSAIFYARRFFIGAQGVGPLGIMEADAMIIQSEQKMMQQADELVVLVDSSKFRRRSSLILCPLERVTTIITDDGVSEEARQMVEAAGITLIIAPAVPASAAGGEKRRLCLGRVRKRRGRNMQRSTGGRLE